MDGFKYSVSKGRLRRVRTPEGSRFFRLPIGALITPASIYAARRRVGDDLKLEAALSREDLQNRGAQGMMDRSEAIRAANIAEIRRKLAEEEARKKNIPGQKRRVVEAQPGVVIGTRTAEAFGRMRRRLDEDDLKASLERARRADRRRARRRKPPSS
jgi:hypothetical protein